MTVTRGRTCANKVAYNSKHEANEHVSWRKRKFGAIHIHAYKCPYCKLWHVGHRMRHS